MRFIETKDGTQLFIKDWGTGRPVVLVSGWCINCDSWEYVMNELPHQGVRCIAYDPRGCGRSDQPWTGYDYDTLADDLAALLKGLNLQEATLVGHSMGCGTVVRYLTRHGQARVSRAVLVSTTTPFLLKTQDNPDGLDQSNLDAMITALKRDRAAYIAGIAPGFFGLEEHNKEVSKELMDWAIALTLQASSQAAIELLRTNFLTDQREELRHVTVPTLIIHGDADQSCALELSARKTHQRIAGSKLTVYEGQPHGIYITQAKRLSEDLLSFVKEG